MNTYLLDANVLIASVIPEHVHHTRVSRWWPDSEQLALCPVVEGALARFLMRMGESGSTAQRVLGMVREQQGTVFWPDDLSYRDVGLADLRGHRQTTDAYLAALAAYHGGYLATLDEGLAQLRPEVCCLIPE